MNEKKKLQPKVRFREFTGENAPDWEQRKLGDLASIGSGRDYKHLSSGNIPVYGTGGYMLSVNEYLSDKDAIGIGRKGTIDKPYILNAPFWTVDTLFFVVPKNQVDLQYLFSVFQKIYWKKYDESTGVPSLSKQSIDNITIYSALYEEQKRIGKFVGKLEYLITLHQRKLEQLEQLKNTLLSKMFPKSGTNIPEIRFSGFTDAWKQRKLEEIIVKEIKGKAKSENISTNFANKGSLYLDTEYLNGGKPKYVSLPSDTDENDIIILWDGSQAGKLYKGVVGALGSTLKAYKIPEHTLFYYYQMLGSQEKIYNQYRTPNIPHVVKSFTSEFMIWDTSNDEKTLIIDIYSNLFNYIAIHQRKLDQLKNLKQTLLNKMFI